jgi:hypothetical protein
MWTGSEALCLSTATPRRCTAGRPSSNKQTTVIAEGDGVDELREQSFAFASHENGINGRASDFPVRNERFD